MRVAAAAAAAAVLLLSLCVTVLAGDQLEIKMGDRTFFIVSPDTPLSPAPGLILWYHGIGQWCYGQVFACDQLQSTLRERGYNFMCVSVCGQDGNWDNGGNKDIDFTRSIIKYMHDNYNVDTSKAIASGWSMGGMFVTHMTCATGSALVQGVNPISCGYTCDHLPNPVNFIGYDGMYDNLCNGWVVNAFNSYASNMGCNSGSGDHRQMQCQGKYLELIRWPAGHAIPDLTKEVPRWITQIFPTWDSPKMTCYQARGEGESVHMLCPKGQTITAVDFASYGNPSGSCPSSLVKGSCDSTTSLSVAQSLCVGKQSCTVVGNNTYFGDPCPGTAKHLALAVSCSGDKPPITSPCSTAQEFTDLTVSCPTEQLIDSVQFASYGTPTGDCNSGFVASTCAANTTMSVVQSKCVSKQSCTVPASNDVFGDPCPTILKRLYVKVACK